MTNNARISTFNSSDYDFKIYISSAPTRDAHADSDAKDYHIILHSTVGQLCTCFTFISHRSEPGKYKHHHKHSLRGGVKSPETGKDEHRHCDRMEKQLVGYLTDRDFKAFEDAFWETKPRASQTAVFRWLWELVDRKLLHETDVERVSPKFERGAFKKAYIDRRK